MQETIWVQHNNPKRPHLPRICSLLQHSATKRGSRTSVYSYRRNM